MMSVAVQGNTVTQTSAPKELFRTSMQVDSTINQYAVSGDGKRFLYGEPVDEGSRPITVVLNWYAGLKH
jgi:hypothetical protein